MPALVVGILNVTPDSFSDGGSFLDPAQAIMHAHALREQGADIIEIGGDSTRSGSCCVGPHEEWRRVGEVVRALAAQMPVAVDTHHHTVASQALAAGAVMINDISCGHDRQLLAAVASSQAKLTMMFSRCPAPHDFTHLEQPLVGDVVLVARQGLKAARDRAVECGIDSERLVLDPGMGAFISAEPEHSWALLGRFGEFAELGCALMLGVSRKGFLKQPAEQAVLERDPHSALCAALLANRISTSLYIRTHNPALTRQFFNVYSRLAG